MRNRRIIRALLSFDFDDNNNKNDSLGIGVVIELIITLSVIGVLVGGRLVPALKGFINDNINTFLIAVCFIFAGIMLGVYSKSKKSEEAPKRVSLDNLPERQTKELDINEELNKVIVADSKNRIWFSSFLLCFIISFIFIYVAIESSEDRQTTYLILSIFFIVMAIINLYCFKSKQNKIKSDFKSNCAYTLLKALNPNIKYYKNLTKEGEEEQKKNYIKYNYKLESVEEANLQDFYLGTSLGENIKIFNVTAMDIHKTNGRRYLSNFDGIFAILKKNNEIEHTINIKTKGLAFEKEGLITSEKINTSFNIYSDDPNQLDKLDNNVYEIINTFYERFKSNFEINIFDDVISIKYCANKTGGKFSNWLSTNYKQELMLYFSIYKVLMDLSNYID